MTIPDVKIVIDSGRERQFSMLESLSESEDTTTVVGSQLTTVNISQASARQRAGRAGRVSAGLCYRLYTEKRFENRFEPFTKPEMLRLDLQQLVLHSLSMYHSKIGHPLNLLLGAPDPPPEAKLRQTLRGLANQGLIVLGDGSKFLHDGSSNVDDAAAEEEEGEGRGEKNYNRIELTPLGEAVGFLPASPRIGRLLFVGLAFRAIEPALSIAALLSVPSAFVPPEHTVIDGRGWEGCSDIALQLDAYHEYLAKGNKERARDLQRSVFEQVTRVRDQFQYAMKNTVLKSKDQGESCETAIDDWKAWNTNAHRVGAVAALICNASPYIAHLVGGTSNFATRDIAGYARMHPSSTNFDKAKRTHWYLYNELRTTTAPFLQVTTAASPLELALFSDASVDGNADKELSLPNCLFVADQWVPVEVSTSSQRDAFLKLRRLLTYEILQQLAQKPGSVLSDSNYNQTVLFVLSAIEHQRLQR